MRFLKDCFVRLKQYPSAMIGLAVIGLLVLMSIITVIVIPYGDAVDLWRGEDNLWIDTPRNARPTWVTWFSGTSLPKTQIIRSEEFDTKVNPIGEGKSGFEIPLTFEYTADEFPSELNLFLEASFERTGPHVQVTWETPDGRKIPLDSLSIKKKHRYAISADSRLSRRLGGSAPEQILLADPDKEVRTPLHGRYTLRVHGILFEQKAEIKARLVIYGKVYGLAGTDHRRRDLMVALLWGTPVALVFGLLEAAGTSVTTLFIAAVGVWYVKWVDAVIQRVTEVNMVLPTLPILIMIGTLYSTSIWLMLGVVILLGIFSAGVKTYRAMLLPLMASPYIEAARSYGAGDFRIITRYMLPRVLPVLIPSFVTLIPSYVFLEASLAVLGLGDPLLPTWGKVLNDAQANGALWKGYFYWVLQPAALLTVTGLGFAMVGFALDRLFNPRLRQI